MKLCALTAILCLSATGAIACTKPILGTEFSVTIPTKPDQKLFTQALLLTTNYERCKAGKAALGTHATLRKAASIHSTNMAKTKVFNHTSRAGNAKTVKDRAKLANLKWRWLGENIALQNRYQFGDRVPFRIVDLSKCEFADTTTGSLIAAHTYASLAQSVTQSWMASKGHRENIQSRYAGRMAAAMTFDRSAANCGKIYITQVFSN